MKKLSIYICLFKANSTIFFFLMIIIHSAHYIEVLIESTKLSLIVEIKFFIYYKVSISLVVKHFRYSVSIWWSKGKLFENLCFILQHIFSLVLTAKSHFCHSCISPTCFVLFRAVKGFSPQHVRWRAD